MVPDGGGIDKPTCLGDGGDETMEQGEGSIKMPGPGDEDTEINGQGMEMLKFQDGGPSKTLLGICVLRIRGRS